MSNFVEFKGSFLSINTEVKNDVVTVQMFGFFLNDDRELVKELPDRIANIPQQTIVIDLTNILMIDEFGFGFLLLLNGVATLAKKRIVMQIDEKTIGPKLIALGLPKIIPINSSKNA